MFMKEGKGKGRGRRGERQGPRTRRGGKGSMGMAQSA